MDCYRELVVRSLEGWNILRRWREGEMKVEREAKMEGE